jgi:hypothetical protein
MMISLACSNISIFPVDLLAPTGRNRSSGEQLAQKPLVESGSTISDLSDLSKFGQFVEFRFFPNFALACHPFSCRRQWRNFSRNPRKFPRKSGPAITIAGPPSSLRPMPAVLRRMRFQERLVVRAVA